MSYENSLFAKTIEGHLDKWNEIITAAENYTDAEAEELYFADYSISVKPQYNVVSQKRMRDLRKCLYVEQLKTHQVRAKKVLSDIESMKLMFLQTYMKPEHGFITGKGPTLLNFAAGLLEAMMKLKFRAEQVMTKMETWLYTSKFTMMSRLNSNIVDYQDDIKMSVDAVAAKLDDIKYKLP